MGSFRHLSVCFLIIEGQGRGGGYIARVSNVVYTTAAVLVVRAFDVVSAHVGGFSADGIVHQRGAVCLLAEGNLVLAAVEHAVCELHVVVHGVVDLVC